MISNKEIALYKKAIQTFHIATIIVSVLFASIILIVGTWVIWRDWNIDWMTKAAWFVCVIAIPLYPLRLTTPILQKIDSAKIDECVHIKDITVAKVKDIDIQILPARYSFGICLPIFMDLMLPFLFAMFASGFFTNGMFITIWVRFLVSCVIVHFVSYGTIVFYVCAYNVKKRELVKTLPLYLLNEKNLTVAKQEREKAANDKTAAHNLINQCGMKFFIKYYNAIKRLPLRDVEVDENYAPDERNERLSAAKKIIDDNLTVLAIDNILENYGDILTEKELQNAKSIKESLERDK